MFKIYCYLNYRPIPTLLLNLILLLSTKFKLCGRMSICKYLATQNLKIKNLGDYFLREKNLFVRITKM